MWEDYAWDDSEAQFREVLAFQSDRSSFSFACIGLASICCMRHEFDEAEILLKRALTADPLSPSLNYGIIHLQYRIGNYDRALSDAELARANGCDSAGIRVVVGLISLVLGRLEDAVRELSAAAQAYPNHPTIMGALGYAYAISGYEGQARAILADLKRNVSVHANCFAYGIALVCLGLNDLDESLEWLQEAYEDRPIWLLTIPFDQLFAPLNQYPRFLSLTNKMHLSKVPLLREKAVECSDRQAPQRLAGE
jgi:tetratricopeptide (TPR) repeat protein